MKDQFGGAINYNPYLLAVNIFLLMYYLLDWYKYQRSTGKTINWWYINLFLYFIVPFVIIYPFCGSSFNILSVGAENVGIIQDNLLLAYLISLSGYISIFIGRYICDYMEFKSKRTPLLLLPFYNSIGRYFKFVTYSKILVFRVTILYLLIVFIYIIFILSSGYGVNPRAFFLATPLARPIYNFITSLFGIIFSLLSTRILQFNLPYEKRLLLIVVVSGLFLGVRAPLFLQGLTFGVLYITYKNNSYISGWKIIGIIAIVLALLVTFAILRSGISTSFENQELSIVFLYEIFYGNTFSDLRDFSWVLGYWNGTYYYGISYLSAFLSFIPSALFSFRSQWGIGVLIVNMVGMDPTIHPGLRPGLFGEMYLNFGVIGVIVYGLILGYVLRWASTSIENSAKKNDVIAGSSAIHIISFFVFLSNSAGFFSFYVNLILLAVLYALLKIKLTLNAHEYSVR
jgi:oligosaccharide repeat unit polymerase